MTILGIRANIVWNTNGPDKYSGPYEIDWIEGNSRKKLHIFGSRSSAKRGSQAQLKAYYTSAATWFTLKSMADYLFKDFKSTKKIVNIVTKIAISELALVTKSIYDYDNNVMTKSHEKISRLIKKEDYDIPSIDKGAVEKIAWRTSSTGRLDSFTNFGSYHIMNENIRGYQLRWLYQDKGTFIGSYASLDAAKTAANRHHLSILAGAAAEPFRKLRKRK